LDDHPCEPLALDDALIGWKDLQGCDGRQARLRRCLVNPIEDRPVMGTVGCKTFPSLVDLRRGGFGQDQAFGWIEQIDSTLSEFDCQSVIIKNRVIASEAQAKAPFSV
jgi:hypothetical protein